MHRFATNTLYLALALLSTACSGPQRVTSEPALPAGWSDAVPLIPRDAFFANPSRILPSLSPDGTRLGYLAPDEGVMNVWVRTLGEDDDHVVTRDRQRGVRAFGWAGNSEQIIYIQDRDGDENWRVYSVPFEGGDAVDLTPLDGVQARLIAMEPSSPDEILVGLNERDPALHDIFRVNVRTGERELVYENDVNATRFTADHELEVRVAMVATDEGGYRILHRPAADEPWQEVVAVPQEDAMSFGAIAFAEDNRTLYLLNSFGANAAELRSLDVATGEQRVIASDPRYDASNVMLHPTRYEPEAVAFTRDRVEWTLLNPELEADFAVLRTLHDGELEVVDRDRADEVWVVAYSQDVGPVVYYAYDRARRLGTFLFAARPELEGLPLSPMEPVEYVARDGLTVHGYLTVPVGMDPESLPVVLFIHGGPWARDVWGYNSVVQWLANRGYAVLQVNYRSSTGYGKDFVNAGDRQWGLAVQDDISDGVAWIVDQGIADPDRVCIMGASFGGYATLAGLTFTPDLYACGVDIVGPSNLITLLEAIPPYWRPIRSMFTSRVGDPEADAEFLRSISPLFYVDRIRAPLLIGQGANDPRVAQVESDQIVEAMRERGIPVTYVLYPDEGHGFVRPENRLSFFAVTEAFLAAHLGGRYEPIGTAFEGSPIEVLEGAEHVPGLQDAIGGGD